MSHNVVNQAVLQCNQGSKTSNLKVSSQDFSFIEGELQATEEDNKAFENILPFGNCSLKSRYNKPCVPQPDSWQNTSEFTIEGKKELLKDSICPCQMGGIISIKEVGQDFISEI